MPAPGDKDKKAPVDTGRRDFIALGLGAVAGAIGDAEVRNWMGAKKKDSEPKLDFSLPPEVLEALGRGDLKIVALAKTIANEYGRLAEAEEEWRAVLHERIDALPTYGPESLALLKLLTAALKLSAINAGRYKDAREEIIRALGSHAAGSGQRKPAPEPKPKTTMG